MTGAASLQASSPAQLIHLASLAAAAGRTRGRGDPVLLLAAARLERLAGVMDIEPPPHATRPYAPATNPSAVSPPQEQDGRLGFERLVNEAVRNAAREGAMVAGVVRDLRALSPRPSGATRWFGGLPARTCHEAVLREPPGTVDICLSWSSAAEGLLEVVAADGGSISGRAVGGGARVIFTSDGRPLRLRVCNPAAGSADFAVTIARLKDPEA